MSIQAMPRGPGLPASRSAAKIKRSPEGKNLPCCREPAENADAIGVLAVQVLHDDGTLEIDERCPRHGLDSARTIEDDELRAIIVQIGYT